MLAGGDSIDDVAVLRAGAAPELFDATRAPSTVGSWLRAALAFALLVQASQHHNTKLRDIADHLVRSGSLHDSESPTRVPPAGGQE